MCRHSMGLVLKKILLATCAMTRGACFDLLVIYEKKGHVVPCTECRHHPGRRAVTQRSFVVARLRTESPSLLLVNSGNVLIGSESLPSCDQVIVAVHNALDDDEVNGCARDFWTDKAETLALLKDAKFAVLSANPLDAENGEPLSRPYVVRKVNGQRIGVIDVAEAPAGMD